MSTKVCEHCGEAHSPINAEELQRLCQHAATSIHEAFDEEYKHEWVGIIVMLVNENGIAINTNLDTERARVVLKMASDQAEQNTPKVAVVSIPDRDDESLS